MKHEAEGVEEMSEVMGEVAGSGEMETDGATEVEMEEREA